MHIKKPRLSTPGPTPLYPPALRAMMGSDIHHRTEDFRKVYRGCLAGLKEVMGTANDVMLFASSGTGAMDAAVSNLFSKGDKVIVCIAGKFGERWLEIVKAYGLDATAITVPYGDAVSPQQLQDVLAAAPGVRGVFVQASESSTGAAHDVKAMGAAVAKTDAILVVDAITGLGTMPLDIDGWGLDVVISGSQKAFMIPPGLAFLSVSPKAWRFAETATLPHYYFNLKKEKKSGDGGESYMDARHRSDSRAGGGARLHQASGHGESGGKCADACRGDTRGGSGDGTRTVHSALTGRGRNRGAATGWDGFGRDREGVSRTVRHGDRERTRDR